MKLEHVHEFERECEVPGIAEQVREIHAGDQKKVAQRIQKLRDEVAPPAVDGKDVRDMPGREGDTLRWVEYDLGHLPK